CAHAAFECGTLWTWANSPEIARWWNSSIASWVRYCRPAMLMVFSQPFLRQRQAVHGVMPTFSIHFERLMTAAPGFECVLSFNISLRNDILRVAVVKRCITYTFGQAFFLYDGRFRSLASPTARLDAETLARTISTFP